MTKNEEKVLNIIFKSYPKVSTVWSLFQYMYLDVDIKKYGFVLNKEYNNFNTQLIKDLLIDELEELQRATIDEENYITYYYLNLLKLLRKERKFIAAFDKLNTLDNAYSTDKDFLELVDYKLRYNGTQTNIQNDTQTKRSNTINSNCTATSRCN